MDDIHNGSNGFSSNMKVNGATVNRRSESTGTENPPKRRWNRSSSLDLEIVGASG